MLLCIALQEALAQRCKQQAQRDDALLAVHQELPPHVCTARHKRALRQVDGTQGVDVQVAHRAAVSAIAEGVDQVVQQRDGILRLPVVGALDVGQGEQVVLEELVHKHDAARHLLGLRAAACRS